MLNPNFLGIQAVTYPEIVTLRGIFDSHIHPRDDDEDEDGRSELVIPHFADAFEIVLGIGNTKTALTTPELARAKKARWQSFVPAHRKMKIHVAGLLTETSDPLGIIVGYDKPNGKEDWLAMKMFLRAASNAHGKDVDDVSRVIPCLRAMAQRNWQHKRQSMTLKIHAERKVDVFGRRMLILTRERAAIERDIPFILEQVPELCIVICHVSDASTIEAIRYLRKKGFKVFGEIAPHYTEYTVDDLFEDGKGGTGMDCNKFCLPIFKTESDRRALEAEMVSGSDLWEFGSDGACWAEDPTRGGGVKIPTSGIVLGGQTQIQEAVVSYVIEKFLEAGKSESDMNAYLSDNGRKRYGLPPSEITVTFKREDWVVPQYIWRKSPHFGTLRARVAMGGQTRKYRIVRTDVPALPF